MAASARLMLERATKSWVYRRRLPSEFQSAPIVVSPAAGLKYLFRSMSSVDPDLLRNARELIRPGDVTWDVGANIGLFTFAAAALAGPSGAVIAFEPDVWLVQLLRKSRRLQSDLSAPITIVPAAVAAKPALRQFNIARRSRASNSLAGYGQSQMGGVFEEQTVPAFNLDWLLGTLKAPDIIKCDVEGAELEVFGNQPRILRDVRPVIICEVSQAAAPELTDTLRSAGYRIFDGELTLKGAKEIAWASWNTIAIPEEKVARLAGRTSPVAA